HAPVIVASQFIQAHSYATSDLNGDGRLDLVGFLAFSFINVPEYGVQVLLGRGDGSFEESVVYSVPSAGDDLPARLAIADVNGDSRPDILVLSQELWVLLGRGDGTFLDPVKSRTWDSYASNGDMIILDEDGDGLPDVVFSSQSYSSDGSLQPSVVARLRN